MMRRRQQLSRREVLGMAVASPALAAFRGIGEATRPAVRLERQSFVDAPYAAVRIDGAKAAAVEVVREWNGPFCRSRIVNRAAEAVRLREIVLFDVDAALSPATVLYGEGFQMLTQTGGTVGSPVDYSQYTDASHYKIPAGDGARAYYGLLTLTPPGEDSRLLAFTSCARFSGRFQLRGTSLQVVVDTEGLSLGPGEAWPLEEFMFGSGPDRARLLADLATRVAVHHPPMTFSAPPTGWCSWYCFGPRVTAQQVLENLDVIATRIPGLKYVQIDDGYQSAMGDWLDTGAAFGGSVRTVLDQIRARGFEPAIWAAPFVAEAASAVFRQHHDWFMQDADGAPLRSDKVTFGGWRRGPWYAMDGSHPAVQDHLERVFRTMRHEWGCTYFKLDANFWGAMHGARRHDARTTRIEAYRRGMEAIRRGAGDAFLLGCNHPIWPSFGLLHGSRSSNDIKRTWDRVSTTARQNLSRNWQNGRLWWNDPDALVLSNDLTDEECRFHATAIYASGGMVLSGDDLTALPPPRAAMLRRLLPPAGVAAEFNDTSLEVGTIRLRDSRMACFFNWDDRPRTLSCPAGQSATATDFWTDAPVVPRSDTITLDMAPRSARLLRLS